jgi:hypothetical protein
VRHIPATRLGSIVVRDIAIDEIAASSRATPIDRMA